MCQVVFLGRFDDGEMGKLLLQSYLIHLFGFKEMEKMNENVTAKNKEEGFQFGIRDLILQKMLLLHTER